MHINIYFQDNLRKIQFFNNEHHKHNQPNRNSQPAVNIKDKTKNKHTICIIVFKILQGYMITLATTTTDGSQRVQVHFKARQARLNMWNIDIVPSKICLQAFCRKAALTSVL